MLIGTRWAAALETARRRGSPEWGYAVVAEAQPSDVVFHWHTSRAGRPALSGWSVITVRLPTGTA
jgi:hypothetical protein